MARARPSGSAGATPSGGGQRTPRRPAWRRGGGPSSPPGVTVAGRRRRPAAGAAQTARLLPPQPPVASGTPRRVDPNPAVELEDVLIRVHACCRVAIGVHRPERGGKWGKYRRPFGGTPPNILVSGPG